MGLDRWPVVCDRRVPGLCVRVALLGARLGQGQEDPVK